MTELVLAVVVTCILGALVVSANRTYLVRAEIAEGLEAASSWQRAIERSFRSSGQVPADRAEAQGPAAWIEIQSSYVAEIDVVDGRIDVTYGKAAHAAIAGRRVSLTPYETATQDVVWVCGNAVPGPGLEPLGFAGGGAQPTQASATVEARYLPSTCR